MDKQGKPVPIIISQPSLFLGNRDTEPRQIVIAKVKDDQNHTFYIVITHLTTMRDERVNLKIYNQASENRYK